MTDDFLGAARKLLPPDVDVVTLPALEPSPVSVTAEQAEVAVGAARARALSVLREAWDDATDGLGSPAQVMVRWRAISDDGQWVSAAAVGRHAGTGDEDTSQRLEAVTARLVAAGWRATRRDPAPPETFGIDAQQGDVALTVTVWSSVPAYDVEVRSGAVAAGQVAATLLADPVERLPWSHADA